MKKIIFVSIRGTLILLIVALLASGCMFYNVRDNIRRQKYGVAKGVTFNHWSVERKLEHEVELLVKSVDKMVFTKPQNAYLDPATGGKVEEVYGKKVNIRETINQIMNAQPHTSVSPVIVMLDPEVSVDVYRNIQNRVGGFQTWYGGGGRGQNIMLAAQSLNNYLIAPGEIFSFNRATGPRTPERGYQLAPIIVGRTVIPGYGGGVCQVSTTLYNAVKAAELEIVERYPHSRPVDYVPRGRDATVSDYLDFKFRNNTDHYILLKSSAYHYRLSIEIWQ